MSEIARQFDEFNLRARVYPALLMCMPLLVNIALLAPLAPLARLAPVAVAIGLVFAIADWVRGRGQALERSLVEAWQGMPTQRALRLIGAENPALTDRRRANVERLLEETLPSRRHEASSPDRARQAYETSIRALIPRVRGKEKNLLLHEENIRYSFRRNSLAVRPMSLALAASCALGDAAAIWTDYHRREAVMGVGVTVAAAIVWLVVVREAWVRQAANTYSDRFFDAIETL